MLFRSGPENDVTHEYFSTTFAATALNPSVKATLILVDSAHQRVRALPPNVAVQVLVDGVEVDRRRFDATCLCARFNTNVTGTTAQYFSYRVVESPTNQLLLGRELTIGPIQIAATGTSSVGALSGGVSVRAKFKTALIQFRAPAYVLRVRETIARMMGVELSRVEIPNTDAEIVFTRGTEHENLDEWTGTKATITFHNPTSASINRKSAEELEAEFLQIRPRCDAQDLFLDSVFRILQDRDCDPAAFRAQKVARQTCVDGGTSTCECYDQADENVLAFNLQMERCFDNPDLYSEMYLLCTEIQTCATVADTVLFQCESILNQETYSLAWVAAPVGGFVLLVGGLVIAKKRGLLRRTGGRPKLHHHETRGRI